MRVVVPGRGHCVTVDVTGADSEYYLLGPFAAGDHIRRFVYHLHSAQVALGWISAVYGFSGEASAEAFGSGTCVFERGENYNQGQPHMGWMLQKDGNSFGMLPVGIVNEVGSLWMVAFVSVLTVGATVRGQVGVEVLRVQGFKEGESVAP